MEEISKWHKKNKLTDTRSPIIMDNRIRKSTPMNWIKGLVQHSKKITGYDKHLKKVRGHQTPKHCDYNKQDYGGLLNVMVIAIGNVIGNPSSNPEQGSLHFTLC